METRLGNSLNLSDFSLAGKFYSTAGKQLNKIVNPISIDNRQICSPTDDQGTTSYCAAYSCAQYLESFYWKNTGVPIQLDAEAIFKKAKEIDGLGPKVAGTTLRAALDAGIMLCGWDETKNKTEIFDGAKMSKQELIEFVKFLIHKHELLLTGFTITESWSKCSKKTGFKVGNSGKMLGAHCVLGCGYDKDCFYIQNSWGRKWGASGFGMVPWNVFYKQFEYCAWIKRILA